MSIKKCEYCEKEFEINDNRIQERKRKFCSTKCFVLKRTKIKRIKCLYCKKEFKQRNEKQRFVLLNVIV